MLLSIQKEESIASTCPETWFLCSRQSTHTDTLAPYWIQLLLLARIALF